MKADLLTAFVGQLRGIAGVGGFIFLLASAAHGLADDEIELLSGTRIQGKIIERSEQSVRIQITVDNRQLIRTYPLDRVRSISQGDKRSATDTSSTNNATSAAAATRDDFIQRSPEAIDSMIEQAGRTPPEWLKSTLLDYPETLDLSWPEPTPVVWNYTRNVDHYLWDVINSNPTRYRSGVRLMVHLLDVNKANERTRARIFNEMGRMYFEFFKDYARAASCWRQAKVDQDAKFLETPNPAHLAECYWKLGNRPLAVALLERVPLTLATIKLWGDMKETQKALQFCDDALKKGLPSTQVYLIAGDVCRTAKDFAKATEYYRKILATAVSPTQAQQIKRDQDRASATLEVIRLFDTVDVRKIADGSYAGKSLGYAGNLEVEAAVKGGRVESIQVIQNSDRQYYHAVEDTIRRIVTKQSVSGIDAISGATFTSEAVIRASAKALAEGMNANAPRQ